MHRVRPGRVIGCKQRMMSGFRMAFPGDAAPQLSARVGRVVASTDGEVRVVARTAHSARWAGGGLDTPEAAARTHCTSRRSEERISRLERASPRTASPSSVAQVELSPSSRRQQAPSALSPHGYRRSGQFTSFFLHSSFIVFFYVYDPASLRSLLRIDDVDKLGLERRPADQEAVYVRRGCCMPPARQPTTQQDETGRDTHRAPRSSRRSRSRRR